MDPRSTYREAAVRGASPLQLVVFLYEEAIADLRRAIVALRNGDIEARTRAINHALIVIGHLQGSLDLERGETVAQNLALFYNLMRGSLVQAQREQSATILEQQIGHLVLLHEAWQEVERRNRNSAPPANSPGAAARPAEEDSGCNSAAGGWDA